MAHNLKGFIPRLAEIRDKSPLFNTLHATAESLQKHLESGDLNSVQIVEEYHRTICRHNGYLNAVYALASDALKRAADMDNLRAKGQVLGPLHGIPIIIKDNIDYKGMPTTAGVFCLKDADPGSSATIVESLHRAGAIILGKATLSELAWFKGTGIRCGWSAAAGQSQSAYVVGGLDWSDSVNGHSSPSGSSSGSCIAASAGFAPLTVGTETFGSLVSPATRASLYTIKPTRGIVPGKGILPISLKYDTAGPIAKTPLDLANLLAVLVDPSQTKIPEGGYAAVAVHGDLKNFKIGTLNPETWTVPAWLVTPVPQATKQIQEETKAAYAKLKSLVKVYHEDITQQTEDDFQYEGKMSLMERLIMTFEEDINKYLSTNQGSHIRTLQEMVDWNLKHPDEALTSEYPNQDLLVQSLEADHSPEKLARLEKHLEKVGDKFEALFEERDIDIIVAPGDSSLFNFSAACGLPIGTLPLSYLEYNGRPIGLQVAARKHGESVLLEFMSAWEETFRPRKAPKAFLDAPEK